MDYFDAEFHIAKPLDDDNIYAKFKIAVLEIRKGAMQYLVDYVEEMANQELPLDLNTVSQILEIYEKTYQVL